MGFWRVLLVAAMLMVAVGCSGGAGGSGAEGSGESEGEEAASEETGSGVGEGPEADEGSGAGGASEGADDPREESEPPFEAISAPEGAEAAEISADCAAQQGASESQYGQGAREEGPPGFDQSEGELNVCEAPGGPMLTEGIADESDGPLGEHRLLAYYGHPASDQMGILGEYEPEEFAERLRSTAESYAAADPETPVIPTIELIASVAQRDSGADGLYLNRTPPEVIEEYAQLAEENGFLLMLDIQLGRSTIAEEVEALRPFLERPYVHLAIDTEYSVEEGEVPGVNLGTVDGAEVQESIQTVHELVEEEGLPDKIVLVHQFESGIVQNPEAIQPTENVQVVLNADGFGAQVDKVTKYDILHAQEPIQYGGFKVFYRQDTPVMTPEQVLQLDPAPAVVNLQ